VERSGNRRRTGCGNDGESGQYGRPTWWRRDEHYATLRREIDKVGSLQFGRVALGCEHHADGVSRPAEAPACAAIGARVSMRGDAVDVRNVAAVRHAEL
jgi:hypothetical protein